MQVKKNFIPIFIVNTKETETFYRKNFPNSVDKFLIYMKEHEFLKRETNQKIIIKKALDLEKNGHDAK